MCAASHTASGTGPSLGSAPLLKAARSSRRSSPTGTLTLSSGSKWSLSAKTHVIACHGASGSHSIGSVSTPVEGVWNDVSMSRILAASQSTFRGIISPRPRCSSALAHIMSKLRNSSLPCSWGLEALVVIGVLSHFVQPVHRLACSPIASKVEWAKPHVPVSGYPAVNPNGPFGRVPEHVEIQLPRLAHYSSSIKT